MESKIVRVPTSISQFQALANKCIEMDDYKGALCHLNNAARKCKRKSQIVAVYLDIGRLYSIMNKLAYANDIFFKVLSVDPENEEAKMLLMLNFLSLDEKDIARYYYSQAKDFIEKRRMSNREEIKKIFETEFGEDYNESDFEVMSVFDMDFEKLLCSKKDPSTAFKVIDDNSRYRKKIEEVIKAIREENFGLAIDLANEAIQYNVSESRKELAYYSKGLSLLELGYAKEAKEIAQRELDINPDNMDIRMLLCEALTSLNEKEKIDEVVAPILKNPPTEFQQVRRVMQILFLNKQYNDVIKFIKSRLTNYPDSYSLYEYLGMAYFNNGNIQKAKEVFVLMNNLYADNCTAYAYLYYINSGNKKEIPVNAIYGEWPELNDMLVDYLIDLMDVSKENGIEKYTNKIEQAIPNIYPIIKWLSQSCRVEVYLDLIEDVFYQAKFSNKSNKEIMFLRNKLMQMICNYQFIDPAIKMHIINMAIKMGDKKIPVVSKNIFYIARPFRNITNLYSNSIAEAYYLLCAICMVKTKEEYEHVEENAHHIITLIGSAHVKWKSVTCILAVMYELLFKRKLKEIVPFIKYNENLAQKYMDEINSILENEKE